MYTYLHCMHTTCDVHMQLYAIFIVSNKHSREYYTQSNSHDNYIGESTVTFSLEYFFVFFFFRFIFLKCILEMKFLQIVDPHTLRMQYTWLLGWIRYLTENEHFSGTPSYSNQKSFFNQSKSIWEKSAFSTVKCLPNKDITINIQ